jgi:hypothetical protein
MTLEYVRLCCLRDGLMSVSANQAGVALHFPFRLINYRGELK